jgi:DNA modification methylase
MRTQEQKSKLRVEYIDVSILKPADYNPRTWDKNQIQRLSESIERFGLVDPLIVNKSQERKNIIIGGHFRFEVAKRMGIARVPAVYVDIPDIQKEKELNLRLNRNTGSWDMELLKDFDIETLLDIGFDDTDLASIWDENLGVEDDEFDVGQELKKIKVVKTRPGYIYRLGNHWLGCGDAQDSSFIQKLIGDLLFDMVYLDPPYNISLDYDRGMGKRPKYGGGTSDTKKDHEYEAFLSSSLTNAKGHTKDDCHFFCYCDERYIGLLQNIYKDLDIKSHRVCLWIKNSLNPTPQVAFNKVYEPCVYGTTGSPYLSGSVTNATQVLNQEIGSGNRMASDIYDMFSIWLERRLPTSGYEHPTEKPPTLHERPLRRCTRVGDRVLDLFGGSGSTLIACEQLKRVCYMSELEPIFCDLIIRRYRALTGKEVCRVY